jgi:hypothetical protein
MHEIPSLRCGIIGDQNGMRADQAKTRTGLIILFGRGKVFKKGDDGRVLF